jgi:hypothetical protein
LELQCNALSTTPLVQSRSRAFSLLGRRKMTSRSSKLGCAYCDTASGYDKNAVSETMKRERGMCAHEQDSIGLKRRQLSICVSLAAAAAFWLKKRSYDLIAFHHQLLDNFALLQHKRPIANFSDCINRLFYLLSPVLPVMTLQQARTRQIFQKTEISLIIRYIDGLDFT